MVLGFFMILVDTTIVSVANPTIMRGLDTTMVATLWATSAYLLAYAVPLLITGRLGDRFGPRRIYLLGLAVFTLSSLACGLSTSIEALIAARVFQGLGAALLTPQTMAVITRIFKPRERGSAMAIWGITAGVATLVGPILGGFMLDAWGWEWIFIINVPVGVIAFVLALRFVPKLDTHAHRFDWVGVLLSAAGMFMLVFGIQEGESFDWGTIWGPVSVWGLIIAGAVVLVLFVVWQRVQRGEPLVPLEIFSDRNFSVGSGTIVMVGVSMTGMSLPLMFYLQLVRGLTPTQSALMLVPMAVGSVLLARPVGKLIDRRDPRRIATLGLVLQVASLGLFFVMMRPDTPLWMLLIPSTILGVANAFMWGPLASITTFGLAPELAGAGSGVYNTSRQVGAVLGSAAMAVLMQSRLTAELGEAAGSGAGGEGAAGVGALPTALHEGFSAAMGQSIFLPMAGMLAAAVITLFFARRPERTGQVAVVAGE
ncbi:DHA2 family efflux MFS transporter permease subunit [Leucobacter zeae]|nr:DHA2 family efflux MFS transporter permease subunit [Leucobacter zeae]